MIGVSAALFAVAVWLVAFHLPLKADLAELLPKDAPAVRDLHRLEARVASQDTALVIIVSSNVAEREAAQKQMATELAALPARLVDHVEADDAQTRAFLRAHRHLFVSLDDLKEAKAALADRIKAAKLEANPLYVDLDDDESAAQAKAAKQKLDDLDKKRKDAEAKLEKSGNVNADGTIGLIVLKTAFAKTDVNHGRELVELMRGVQADVMRAHPGVDVGLCGGIVSTTAEHDALLHGMVLSSVVTGLLVGLVLMLYFRSVILLILLSASLIVGTTVAFGVAAITVGELNAATAFLGAIIAGNGVNYGILLIARFLEERRRHGPAAAMAAAVQGTLRPTLVASLGASIAYGSLAATSFRGFADFAVIGAIGMVLCWVASYVLLPPIVLRWYRRREMPPGEPLLGSILSRVLGFRHAPTVCAVAALLAIGGTVITWKYVQADPFEYNIKNLRSDGDEALLSERWMKVSNKTFGAGISGQTYIAADRLDQVPLIVQALRDIDKHAPANDRTVGTVRSILDLVPEHQPEKLAVLSEIRTMLDDPALDALDPDEKARLDDLRPPDGLTAISPDTLPPELAAKLREKDPKKIGYIIGVRPDPHLDEWNGHDLIRFANAVRQIKLPTGETITTSGPDMIFADIVHSIRNDGAVVTGLASIGLILMVVLVVGRNRRAVAVLAATGLGSLGLTAVCALANLKVNFLDFVALPITLGLGVDYAINVAHRHDHQERRSARETLRTSGAAVFVCSLTTIIGYGSLLVSDNLAIRGFGKASLIGEITCLTTALIVVPALLSLGHPPSASSSMPRAAIQKAAAG
ncbi:MAG TPA: MMPL family transporter [Kofleriaceae bacterium]|nr:MMPL family transporter [Kofleriaceae bacterium]